MRRKSNRSIENVEVCNLVILIIWLLRRRNSEKREKIYIVVWRKMIQVCRAMCMMEIELGDEEPR